MTVRLVRQRIGTLTAPSVASSRVFGDTSFLCTRRQGDPAGGAPNHAAHQVRATDGPHLGRDGLQPHSRRRTPTSTSAAVRPRLLSASYASKR